jgi:hypothetical protein
MLDSPEQFFLSRRSRGFFSSLTHPPARFGMSKILMVLLLPHPAASEVRE